MKKKAIIVISIVIIILIGLYLLFVFGKGTKNYISKISNIELEIPKYSFNIKESISEDTYTIRWDTIRKNNSIKNEMRNLSMKNNNYKIIDWGYNDEENIIKEYYIVYEIK